ncbi:hypothetical protein E4T52_10751 [Aureobasidium sp. EXF-3400]|nr:hypothetical protein E4T51_04418 [Aureobasidium sp. EXF-12344]KAI4774293.1 hypothetical protein E4T52_10751 [Aureobasidium sp. EXF-3400]
MRATRLQTKKRAKVRKRIINNIMSKSKSEEPANTTTAMASSSTEGLPAQHVPAGAFPLLSLPGEVLNMIIKEAVTAPNNEIIMLETATTPAFARVNRYLRKSVLPIYLAVNTFRVFTEEPPIAKNHQAMEAKFKIQNQVMDWLNPLGYTTPLFKSLIVHFGVEDDAQMILEYSHVARGLTVRHEASCRYCYKLGERHPVLPRAILDSMPLSINLRHHIEQAEERNTIIASEHALTINDLENDVYSKATGIKRHTLALSMANIMGIERVINQGSMVFSMAVHTINMKRLKDTPNIIKHQNVDYILRKDTST